MNLNHIFFYLIVALVLYLEPVEVAGTITFGIVWKLLLLLVLFFPVLYKVIKEKQIELFAFLSILLAFKVLISYTSIDYFSHTITLFVKAMMFPLLYLFFIQKIEKKESLIFMVKHFSIIIILSFVPYMLGLLEPFGLGYDLAEFGRAGEYGLIGPFIKPHSAAITLAFAMIIITTHINKDNSSFANLFFIALLILGAYELVLTYVRTGFAIYIIVLLYLYLRNINFKKILLMFMTSLAILAAGVYLYQTNDVVKMRIDDKNQYSKGSSGSGGSGRFLFWGNAIDNWLNDDPSVIYIGLGYDYAREKMYEDVGLLIFAHNHFIQILQQEGLIGFVLLVSYLFFIYKFMSRHRSSKYYATTNAIFIGLLIEYMFQGGFFFPLVLYLAAYLAVLKKEGIEILKKEEHYAKKY